MHGIQITHSILETVKSTISTLRSNAKTSCFIVGVTILTKYRVKRPVGVELSRRMDGQNLVFMLIVCMSTLTIAQYADDSDYEDYEIYEDSMPQQSMSFMKGTPFANRVNPNQDDFYIVNDYGDKESMREANVGLNGEPELIIANDDEGFAIVQPVYEQLRWFQVPEKTYQYTKHRIPGYDYEELEITRGNKIGVCDKRSLWSHCVCQFTCLNPNEVDCYVPCDSGCECKADFVFDEETRQCVTPEMCPTGQNLVDFRKQS